MIKKIRDMLFHKKQKPTKAQETLKKKIEIVQQLRQMKMLFTQIENSLPNRHSRKQFRRDFISNDKIGANIIQSVIDNYEKQK
jgi:hypothetical protein